MAGSFDAKGDLDIADGKILLAIGKKKSGKSILGKMYFMSYPGDKVVIDVAGDDGPWGDDVIEISGDVSELPKRWPEHMRDEKKPMTLRYVPNPESKTYVEDMDAIIGMALRHGRSQHDAGRIGCCVLVHETHDLAGANRTPGHM